MDILYFILPNSFKTLKYKQMSRATSMPLFTLGTSIERCSSNCMSNARIGLWDKDGNKCTDDICREICGLCRDENACQWIASWSDFEKEQMLNISEEDTVLSRLVPKQLSISGTSYPSSSVEVVNLANVTIRWNNNGDADSFMIHYYDMSTGSNMINIETLNDSATKVSI